MIRTIANKTLASDAEQCSVMVKLFLQEYFHQEKLDSDCCATELYRNHMSGYHQSPNGNDNIPYPFC